MANIRGYFPKQRIVMSNDEDEVAAKIDLESYVNNLLIVIQEKKTASRFSPADKQMLLDAIDETTKWLGNFQEATKEEYDSRKVELKKISNHLFKKLSSIINKHQSDQRWIHSLQQKFVSDAVLIFGDWPAPTMKFHEPIRSKGLTRMLHQKGSFRILLLDEYKTSSLRLSCKLSPLERFKYVDNPRVYRRSTMPRVKCHGILR
jgi:hypothetical protein